MVVDGETRPVTIVNVSDRGLGGRSATPLLIGTSLSILLPAVGAVRAEVRWSIGGRFGLIFRSPSRIDPATVAAAAESEAMGDPIH